MCKLIRTLVWACFCLLNVSYRAGQGLCSMLAQCSKTHVIRSKSVKCVWILCCSYWKKIILNETNFFSFKYIRENCLSLLVFNGSHTEVNLCCHHRFIGTMSINNKYCKIAFSYRLLLIFNFFLLLLSSYFISILLEKSLFLYF